MRATEVWKRIFADFEAPETGQGVADRIAGSSPLEPLREAPRRLIKYDSGG